MQAGQRLQKQHQLLLMAAWLLRPLKRTLDNPIPSTLMDMA
jgi:hypothetical protein